VGDYRRHLKNLIGVQWFWRSNHRLQNGSKLHSLILIRVLSTTEGHC
jgi:hypothetical protein